MDAFGAGKLVDRINRFRETYGDHFEATQLLNDFAKDSSKSFTQTSEPHTHTHTLTQREG